MKRKVLVAFGSTGYEGGLHGLKHSAQKYFDKVVIFKPNNIDNEFKEKNAKIWNQGRGYGYWIWKPYIILKTLEELNEGDFCFYSDALLNFIDNPKPLFPICEANEGLMLFNQRAYNWQNYIWTKRDCFHLMNAEEDKYIYGDHINAAIQLYQKNDKSIAFVRDFLNYCLNENIITDLPNLYGDNYPGFRDHRHDQSVLSLLAIRYNLKTFRDITQYGNGYSDNDSKYPQLMNHHRSK